MEFRLATIQDLPQILEMYKELVQRIQLQTSPIWDEVYPCCCLPDDIQFNRLYVLLKNSRILSAFALCDTEPGASHVSWANSDGRALYLTRLGVRAGKERRGIGSLMLEYAKATAKAAGFDSLRLFVVDHNLPAIRLYQKYGWNQASGIYRKQTDSNTVLCEYGFEIDL